MSEYKIIVDAVCVLVFNNWATDKFFLLHLISDFGLDPKGQELKQVFCL